MKVEFRSSFAKDLRKVRDLGLKQKVKEAIAAVEAAQSLQQIADVKKLQVGERHYRMRVGDYRIGLVVEEETVVFVRLLARKDIYKYFP